MHDNVGEMQHRVNYVYYISVFYSSFHIVSCVLCVLYPVFYIVSQAYTVHFYITVYFIDPASCLPQL